MFNMMCTYMLLFDSEEEKRPFSYFNPTIGNN